MEPQSSVPSSGYLANESSLYPSPVVSVATKTSPSRYHQINEPYEQLNATQRRHAFGAYRNVRLPGISTSIESFVDSPGDNSYSRSRGLEDDSYGPGYQDPTRLTVPMGNDFVNSNSRTNPYFRHHSYDVPPPPPAPDDGIRRRTLSTIGRGHHSFDSSPYLYRRQSEYDDMAWRGQQNPDNFFFRDGVGGRGNVSGGVPVVSVRDPESEMLMKNSYREESRRQETHYRSASYHDMSNSYHNNTSLTDMSGRTSYQQSQQQQSYRQSDPLASERHFLRRQTEDTYGSYAPSQQQPPVQQKSYPVPNSNYDHYYTKTSPRHQSSIEDRRPLIQEYQSREMYFPNAADNRVVDNATIKPSDNYNLMEPTSGYYPTPANQFTNQVSYDREASHFSAMAPPTVNAPALTTMAPSTTAPTMAVSSSQIYPNPQTVHITANKTYWEWNNNGNYNAANVNYNGGVRNYDYSGTNQYGGTNTGGFPDVLKKDHGMGFSVVHADGHDGQGVNLDICRGGKEDPTTFFRDGVRKIDFVMVYEETNKEAANNFETLQPTTILNRNPLEDQETKGLKKRQKFNLWRQKFMACLSTIGVEIEEDVLEQTKNTIHFIRLHAPWPLLCRYAEELNLRAPIQAHPNPSGNWSEWVLSKLRLPNLMYEDVPNKPLDYYTCPFKTSKLDKFLGSDDLDSFFTRAQRSRMVYEILATTPFGKEKKGEVGIERLVGEGAYTAAFPLHDGPFEHPGSGTPPSQLNVRQILYHYWARWGKWYKYQPLDHIREYFGEKIAIYFAWLGFYTGWLLPAAVVGVLVFLYGVATMDMNQIALEVCNEGNKYQMCPLCESCSMWKLSDICLYKRVAYLFDHPGTVFYAIFMSFWAVTFLEYWKRKSASLAHHWDCMGFQEEEERPRPDFAAKAPYLEKNPITGVKEPSFPQSIRYKRIAAGTGLILLMICLVLIFIVAVIIYRTLVAIPLFQDETLRPVAQMIASMSGALLNLVLIMALGRVYEKLAFGLTTWEMHRTQSEFDDNLTFKVFLFQFINFYSSIFYIAFFKGRFVGYPGHYKHIFGNLRNEDCSNGGCLIELAQQLGVIMVGKQMINNAQEILLPKLKAWWHSKKSKLSTIGESRMEMDYRLVENEGLFQEYLEMVLQFGFITIFVAAFPLAPFFALLNNWVEIRLDAQKFVCETRRAVAERAENIGIWFKILDMIAHFAVISNAFLIAFTSEFIAKLVYKYEHDWNMTGYVNFTLAVSPHEGWLDQNKSECRYRAFRDATGQFSPTHWKILALKLAFVIVFEHVVFGVCRLIDLVVPDIPESLDVKIKRERYLAKEALQDADHVLQKVLIDPESDRVDSDQDLSGGSPMLRKRTLL